MQDGPPEDTEERMGRRYAEQRTHHTTRYVRGGMMSLIAAAVLGVVFLVIALGLFFRSSDD